MIEVQQGGFSKQFSGTKDGKSYNFHRQSLTLTQDNGDRSTKNYVVDREYAPGFYHVDSACMYEFTDERRNSYMRVGRTLKLVPAAREAAQPVKAAA